MSGTLGLLPAELVQHIYDFLEPAFHFAFAITNKFIFHQSGYILELHSRAHSQYHAASDLSPRDLHVREFEVWGTRKEWKEWRSWQVGVDGQVSFAQDELPVLLPLTDNQSEDLAVPGLEAFRDFFRADILKGDDGFFKANIIFSLPRLRVLKFVESERSQSTLAWISLMASECSRLGTQPWPPGLLALEEVFVHVPVKFEEEIDGCFAPAVDLAGLLLLPRIRSVYYRNLGIQDDDDDESFPSDSTVQTLMLDRMRRSNNHEFRSRKAICRAPSGLESFVIRETNVSEYGDHALYTIDEFPRIFSHSSSRATLRQFLSYDPENMQGSATHVFEPAYINTMSDLRVLNLCIGDMQLEALFALGDESVRDRPATSCEICLLDVQDLGYTCPGGIDCEYPDGDRTPNRIANAIPIEEANQAEALQMQSRNQEHLVNHDGLVHQFLIGLPNSLEVLLIYSEEENSEYFYRGYYEENETIDDAVVAMLESERYTNLEAIYLDRIERCVKEPRNVVSFQKAIAAGKKHNVYIYTVANPVHPPGESRFPAMPDRHDLKTGPFGPRDPDWVVDPYTGSWTAPGCGGCGLCDDCLECYTAEAWEAYKNRADA
ncbi:unnamed protein product [Clonostachys rosea]|uniref:F-box domain-containing protein n=1 Tax=Bionectria ochroleuca TaxID=29856 RepID=A0ABY6UK59_BIOOC|nr:unnamed protein product [Clonostachys rosea]